jgi:hypothetical protein
MAVATAASLFIALLLIALSGERAAAVASIRLGEAVALVAPWLAFSIVGAIVVRHGADNKVGWLCSIAGLQVALVALAVGIATFGLAVHPLSSFGTASAWVAHTGSIAIFLAPLLILYRFPNGRPLGPWWRRAELLTVVCVGVLMLTVAIDPMPMLTFPTTWNPMALGQATRLGVLSLIPTFACTAAAIAALVVRFRRGSTLERRQLRLLAIASVVLGLAMVTMPLTSPQLITGGRLSTSTAVINAVAFAAIPLAIGVAIVKDHLYDIDRILNRTLVYAMVSAVLAVVYVVAVVVLSALFEVLAPGVEKTLATAGSTLIAAALFRPVRERAQIAIDRRFDRQRFESARICEAFAGQVRDAVELAAIVGDLRLAVASTVRPSSMTCWIRGGLPDGS